jgi:hypothetical protein
VYSTQQVEKELQQRLQLAQVPRHLVDDIILRGADLNVPAEFGDRWAALWADCQGNNRIQALLAAHADPNQAIDLAFKNLRLGAIAPEPIQVRSLRAREMQDLQGAQRLNVGGVNAIPPGLAGHVRLAQAGDVTVNTDFLTRPHILGDIREILLPQHCVPSAILEGFPHSRISPDLVTNVGGAVRPGGSLQILTGPGAVSIGSDIINWMQQVGFQHVVMTTPDPATVEFRGVK